MMSTLYCYTEKYAVCVSQFLHVCYTLQHTIFPDLLNIIIQIVLQPFCFQLLSVSVPLWKRKTKFHNDSKLQAEHVQSITAAALQTIYWEWNEIICLRPYTNATEIICLRPYTNATEIRRYIFLLTWV